jgi:hypothetical protein
MIWKKILIYDATSVMSRTYLDFLLTGVFTSNMIQSKTDSVAFRMPGKLPYLSNVWPKNCQA